MVQLYKRKGGEVLVNAETPNSQFGANSGGSLPDSISVTRAAAALAPVVPAPADVIMNADRTRMYVSRADGVVSVYDTFTGQVIQNYQVGTKLGGMDLSADGSFLLAVDRTALSSSGGNSVYAIHKLDLATGTVTDFARTFSGIEGPFHDVALYADGTAIATTTLQGSGQTFTYRLNTATGVFTTLTSGSAQAGQVTASADRLDIFLTQGFNVSGPNRVYTLSAEATVDQAAQFGVGSSGNGLHAFAADGSLIAYVERQQGVDIFDGRLNKLTTIAGIQGNNVLGLAFDDHGDNLYLLLTSTREIVKVSTTTWAVIANISLPADLMLWDVLGNERFGGSLVVGADAQFLTWTSPDGLFRIENPTALTAVSGSASGETMTGTSDQDLLYGLDGDDIMSGAGGDDTLRGGAGNDTLDGGTGHDAMYGGAGDDLYLVDDLRDRAAETDASGGSDEVRASVSFALEGNIERLLLTGGDAIDGTGNNLGNQITGNGAANVLKGMAGDDVLTGLGGDDTLNGGTGADQMDGGAGDDTYHVDNLADIVTEAAGGGSDRIVASLSWTLAAGLEIERLEAMSGTTALALTGNAFVQTLVGNNGANTLNGGGGADVLRGLSGNDIYNVDDAAVTVEETSGGGSDRIITSVSYVLAAGASVEFLVTSAPLATTALDLTGNDLGNRLEGNAGVNILRSLGGNDSLFGFDGNDFLVGGAGNDVMVGGLGDDTYYIDSTSDALSEFAGEGFDRIATVITLALAADADIERIDVENLSSTNAIDLTGSAIGNVIYGNDGQNILRGEAGNDELRGFGGDDFLVGGPGTDLMVGGLGNDTFYVDDASDAIGEIAGEGNDRIAASVSFVLSNGADVELLEAVNVAATTAFDLTGSDSNNTITGNAGLNVLRGEGGNDILSGADGDDFLVGGAGNDVMNGGTGNDTYYVDAAGDVVNEFAGEGGNDRVATSITYTLAANADVETLEVADTAGTAAINLTGNNLWNTIGGNAGDNVINGMGGRDTLIGYGGADTFVFSSYGSDNVDFFFDFVSGTDRIALDRSVFTEIGPVGALNPNAFTTSGFNDADDRIFYNPGLGFIYYDPDGSGASGSFVIALLNPGATVTASDIFVI